MKAQQLERKLKADGTLLKLDGIIVANLPGLPDVTAELARRWNAHEELVVALDGVLELSGQACLIPVENYRDEVEAAFSAAQSALANARKEAA